MNLKERLTKQYDAERAAGLAKVEAEYKKKMDALWVVWRSMQKTSTPSASLSPSASVNAAATRTRTKRIKGITQAVDDVTADIQGIFSPEDIHEKVAAMFPNSTVKRQSITDSLWRLEQEQKIRVIVRGRGKRKGEYERIKNPGNSLTQSMSKHEELTM